MPTRRIVGGCCCGANCCGTDAFQLYLDFNVVSGCDCLNDATDVRASNTAGRATLFRQTRGAGSASWRGMAASDTCLPPVAGQSSWVGLLFELFCTDGALSLVVSGIASKTLGSVPSEIDHFTCYTGQDTNADVHFYSCDPILTMTVTGLPMVGTGDCSFCDSDPFTLDLTISETP